MMSQRKSSMSMHGRPSGTDGSDFSYRMVVDSRYTRVAKGKSSLAGLILAQFVILLLGIMYVVSILKDEAVNRFALWSAAVGQLSLIIGEIGRRRSRVNFLKFYMLVSSIAMIISSGCVLKDNPLIEDPSGWQTQKLETIGLCGTIFGVLLQLFTVRTIAALLSNMSPPKRAS